MDSGLVSIGFVCSVIVLVGLWVVGGCVVGLFIRWVCV